MALREADLARPRADKRAKANTAAAPPVVTFTSGDGEVFEIPDLPENLGRATALAGEKSLGKIWGSEQEDQACQDMFGEKSS